jgi:hypothetical protein
MEADAGTRDVIERRPSRSASETANGAATGIRHSTAHPIHRPRTSFTRHQATKSYALRSPLRTPIARVKSGSTIETGVRTSEPT